MNKVIQTSTQDDEASSRKLESDAHFKNTGGKRAIVFSIDNLVKYVEFLTTQPIGIEASQARWKRPTLSTKNTKTAKI